MDLIKKILIRLPSKLKPLKPGKYSARLSSTAISKEGNLSITLSEVKKET